MREWSPEKQAVRGILQEAGRVLVITGAGISADSGIPTFRGPEGVYKGRDPMELASLEGFAQDPALVWEWYAWRLSIVEKAEPNEGHRALVRLEERLKDGFLLLTQNVDGLHREAGSRNLHELHGSIRQFRCAETGRICEPGEIAVEPPFPVRTREGTLARPDVVWYGEMLPETPFRPTERFFREGDVDVCLIVGTTALIHYIQAWIVIARQAGARLITVDPFDSGLAEICDIHIAERAAVALPRLID